ncbi:MAG: APC family permease [Actinomycetota bacterium]
MTEIAAPQRRFRRIVVGRPMQTGQLEETLLPKFLALPIFASDPLSSVAYATESALVVLVAVSATAAHLVLPISIAIAALLAIVVLSYMQTVHAYETSGGAYVVARENLGTIPSLVGAAALLTDYVLTVAVSISAGIFAIASFSPAVGHHKVALSLACLVLIVLANLRGVRESGLIFALPTYLFVLSIAALVVGGSFHHTRAVTPNPLPVGTGAITLFVLLRAFSSGSTALTGVEAIANGVNAFRKPHGRNAALTLATLGTIAIGLFLGVSYLAVQTHARPSATTSVVSQVARSVFTPGTPLAFMYYAVQIFTLVVLIFAANTSFQGFPRLSALLARDRFAPRQFSNLGDRLVFSNGMVVLATVAGLLLWIYGANTNSLIHLYVIGVFTAFTLSQAGMVHYWFRRGGPHWRLKLLVNGVGAIATGMVTLIVVYTKFAEGAWLVTVAIPVLVLTMLGVRRHYDALGRRLHAGAAAVAVAPAAVNRSLVLVESLDDAADTAWRLARRITPGDLRAVHVPTGRTDSGIRARWFQRSGVPLERLDNSRGVAEAVLEQVWRSPRSESEFVTVYVSELFRSTSLREQLRRPRELTLKFRLLSEPGVVVADIPVLEGRTPDEPKRVVARVLVSGVNAASMRAVNYASTLDVDDVRAIHFAFGSEDAAAIRDEWADQGPRIPLEIDEAPYRDLGQPLLGYLRELTADPGTIVVVLMPELVTRGWRRLLHNQRALYVKRLLLFEPQVLLASVPYQVLR